MNKQDQEQRMRSALDFYLGLMQFPTHEKDKDGLYFGELHLAIGSGFAMAWRKKQREIKFLLSEISKYKNQEEMREIHSTINNNKCLSKIDEKFNEDFNQVNALIRIATDVKDKAQLKWGVEKQLKFVIHDFDQDDIDSLFNPELEKSLKNKNTEVAKKEVREMLTNTLQKLELLGKAQKAYRRLEVVSSFSTETREEAEARVKGYEVIRAVGGVKKARSILKEHGINALKVLNNEEEVKAVIVSKDPAFNLYELYIALFSIFQKNLIKHFTDQEVLYKLYKELMGHILALNIPVDDITATRAIKHIIEGKKAREKVEIDKSDIEFLIEFFDELQIISAYLSK